MRLQKSASKPWDPTAGENGLFALRREILYWSSTRVDVIVNSVCPGLVFTSISRAIVTRSTFLRFAVPFFGSILAKSPDYGARFYVTAARTSADQHVSGTFQYYLCCYSSQTNWTTTSRADTFNHYLLQRNTTRWHFLIWAVMWDLRLGH